MTTRKRLLSSVLLFALAAAGCEKSADLGRIQEETLSIVKLHGVEVDRLLHRADALQRRGSAVAREAVGVADASRLLTEARAGIDQLRALVATAPGTLGDAVKSNDLAEVQRSSDDVLQKLDAGAIRVRANLAAVENWLSNVENRPAQAPPPPAAKTDEAPPAAPPGTPPAAPETGGGAGSGSAAGAGSAAPATPPPAAGSGSAQPK
ncbi:MAG: hypothetical protein JNL83_37140 [Myxococcales bacterium]|nr:hypothetical protein [Myxococcales bacterium]